ncbi:MAG: biopolymer transporter ExbD [Spirochaetales bacterium]|nr:biopolymer transporter ExbD [Spirochaetales bacterium]
MRRLAVKSGLELAPIVDVVFLLLTFFLLSANLEKRREIALDLPTGNGREAREKKDLEITIDASGAIHLEGQVVSLSMLDQKMAGLKDPEALECLVAADSKVPYGSVVAVLSLLQKHNLVRVQLLTRER